MFGRSISAAHRRCAIVTLFVCLFWNTVGISTHNHDLADALGAIASKSASPASALQAAGRHNAASGTDVCPGCAFDSACVSGAAAPVVIRPPSASSITPVRDRIDAPGSEPLRHASRGPPAA